MPTPQRVVATRTGTAASGGALGGSSVLSPQTTVRDYNAFLVETLKQGDAERQAILDQFEGLRAAFAPLGDLSSQLQDRTAELHEAQRVITEQGLVLQEERERSARLMAENQKLLAELDDTHAKVQALLQIRLTEADTAGGQRAASEPLMVQIPTPTPRGGATPSSAAARAKPPLATAANGPPRTDTLSLRSVAWGAVPPPSADVPAERTGISSPSGPTTEPTRMADPIPRRGGSAVDAVVHKPPSDALLNALKTEVKTLQQLLDEQRAAYERDRGLRIADARQVEQDLHSGLKKHRRTVEEMQQRLQTAVGDLCTFRHDARIVERTLRGEVEVLTARAAEAERLLAVERSRRSADVKVALESHTARTDHVVDHVRSRLSVRDEQLRQAQLRHAEEIDGLEKQLRSVTEEAGREKRIRIRCEQRLRAEEEGRRADLGMFRQQLRAVEKRIFFNTVHADRSVYETEGLLADAGVQQPQLRVDPMRIAIPCGMPVRRGASPLAVSAAVAAAESAPEGEEEDPGVALAAGESRSPSGSPLHHHSTRDSRRSPAAGGATGRAAGSISEEEAQARQRAARILANLMSEQEEGRETVQRRGHLQEREL